MSLDFFDFGRLLENEKYILINYNFFQNKLLLLA